MADSTQFGEFSSPDKGEKIYSGAYPADSRILSKDGYVCDLGGDGFRQITYGDGEKMNFRVCKLSSTFPMIVNDLMGIYYYQNEIIGRNLREPEYMSEEVAVTPDNLKHDVIRTILPLHDTPNYF